VKSQCLVAGLLALVLGGVAQAQPELQEFASSTGRFRVKMAAKPGQNTVKKNSALGPMRITIHAARVADTGVIHAVCYADVGDLLPKNPKPGFADAFLATVGEETAHGLNAKLTGGRKALLGIYTGREFEGTMTANDDRVRGRAFLVEDRLYVLLAIGPKKGMDRPETDQFFDSFQLEEAAPAEGDDSLKKVVKVETEVKSKLKGNQVKEVKAPGSLERFTDQQGGFTVDLPGKPLASHKVQKSAAGDMTIYTFLSTQQESGLTCSVVYMDLPKGVVQAGSEAQFLDQVAAGLALGASGKVTKSQPVTVKGVNGREYTLEVFNGKGQTRVRMFLHNDRLYQVIAISPLVGNGPGVAEQVLTSFRVNE
jgi:hypothetical protein